MKIYFLSFSDPNLLIDNIPGVFPFFARELPTGPKIMPHLVMEVLENFHESAGVIFNTLYSWESKPLEVIKRKFPVYPIGPLPLMHCPDKSLPEVKTTIWREDESCLKWLDAMPTSSILYVSFGSVASMGVNQIQKLAEGLEASGHPFLWVLRVNMVKGSIKDILPDEFWEKTRSRALVISWAPQLKVLAHAAVGGFLTHCGWHSIVENLSGGCVPMLCWPLIADQHFNAKLLTDEWKVGLQLLQDDDGIVKKEEVTRAVKELMAGKIRQSLIENSLRLKEAACSAFQEGGSSAKYIEGLVQDMTNLSTHTKSDNE
ncbi:hypothetical protein KP509_28G037800 [Ceratopteris richardii]|uniref:UDP-glycosyltransferases domain-containing protein n=1 Tax=Ceratopteris richardii TaxID=49495 RepID=A0A8T2RDT8_CERRI|nr:hypothetical protein KP509_28G037800 [Ceratopteris richardii]